MGITFSGISSGIDTGAIVEAFVNAERAPIRSLEKQKQEYNDQLSALRDLNSKMQKLQSTVEDMASIGDFLKYAATYADEDAMTVTASGDAAPGVYDVKVVQLAQAERDYSKEFADKTTAGLAGEGTLTITIGTESVGVDIAATDTLEDIVDKINAADAGVDASLLNTGSGYRIQITGEDTGSANAITFAQSGSLDLQLTEYKAAQDAMIEVDGYTITSDTNTFDDALPGVSMTVTAVTADAKTLTVAPDSDEIQETLQNFVDQYNEIIKKIKSDDTSSGVMRSLQMQLGMMIADEIGDVGGSFTALSQIGIATQSDGTLKLDADDLEEALSTDIKGVARLFVGSEDGSVSGMATLLSDFIDQYVDTADGVLVSQQNGIERMISSIDDSIAREEDRVARYEEGLVAQFTQMEIQMNQLQSQQNALIGMMM